MITEDPFEKLRCEQKPEESRDTVVMFWAVVLNSGGTLEAPGEIGNKPIMPRCHPSPEEWHRFLWGLGICPLEKLLMGS